MSRRRQPQAGTVYLIHFETRLKHAGHYLGFATDLPQRMSQHRGGNGARLMEVIAAAGIGWKVVRTWAGDRAFERRLKQRKNTPRRLCPVCRGLVAYEDVQGPGLPPPAVSDEVHRPPSRAVRAACEGEADPPF